MAAGNTFSESRRYADEVLAGALSCVQARIYLQSDCGEPQARPNVTTESISRVLSPDSLGSFSTQPPIVAPQYLSGSLDKSRSLGTVNENVSSNIEPPPAWARTINNQPDGYVQGPQHGSTGSPQAGRTAPPPPPRSPSTPLPPQLWKFHEAVATLQAVCTPAPTAAAGGHAHAA